MSILLATFCPSWSEISSAGHTAFAGIIFHFTSNWPFWNSPNLFPEAVKKYEENVTTVTMTSDNVNDNMNLEVLNIDTDLPLFILASDISTAEICV